MKEIDLIFLFLPSCNFSLQEYEDKKEEAKNLYHLLVGSGTNESIPWPTGYHFDARRCLLSQPSPFILRSALTTNQET